MIHNLKCWPEYYNATQTGVKTFELRLDDRRFREGDKLVLNEFMPCRPCKGKGQVATMQVGVLEPFACPDCQGTGGEFTGRSIARVVSFVLTGHEGLHAGYVIMGLHHG